MNPERPDLSDRPRVPTQDIGADLDVISWVLLITSTFAVLTRLGTKKALHRNITIDDAFVIAALVASIGSSVAVSLQTRNGLGKDISIVTPEHQIAYEKSEYATKLFYNATLVFAKLSIISLLQALTSSEQHRYTGIGLACFIGGWGIISELVTAFQCSLPHPWDFLGVTGEVKCYNLGAFWRASAVVNLITDVALIMFPAHVIVPLQMLNSKKFTILVFFSARALDVVATGVQLGYTPNFNSKNPTLRLWEWTMTTQIVQCITIITSCIPYLRPLLEAIPSGMYGADELRRRGNASSSGYSKNHSTSYKMSTALTHKSTKSRRGQQDEEDIGESSSRAHAVLPGMGPLRPDEEAVTVDISSREKQWDSESETSQSRIVKTTVVSTTWHDA